ncbi:MAG TPA: hypothetical protein VKZ50_01785 [bacterium]|nr:hypothetical protein [bacterium]
MDHVPSNQLEWLEDHRHNCPTFYLLIGRHADLTGLAAEIVIEGTQFVAEAPCAILLPTGKLHHHRLTAGSGWSFHLNTCSDYVDSLMDEPGEYVPRGSSSPVADVYRKAERLSAIARQWDVEAGAFRSHDEGPMPVVWKFIDPAEFGDQGLRVHAHQVTGTSYRGGSYSEAIHRHPHDEVTIALPEGDVPMTLEVASVGESVVVTAPIGVYHESGRPHYYRHLSGNGLVLHLMKL